MSEKLILEYLQAAWGLRAEALARVAEALVAHSPRAGAEPAPELAAARRPSVVTEQVSGGVAVIPLRGLITTRPSFLSILFGGGGGLLAFRDALREALSREEVSAVLIDVDSPGGTANLITETAAEIRAACEVKPVVAIANTEAGSAAYWLASQADEVVVTPSGSVGSVGVFALHVDESALNEQIGIAVSLISAGRYKTEGNPFEPLSDEARAAIQAMVDDCYEIFVGDVAQGRGVSAAAVRSGFGEGRMVRPRQAVDLGMADRIETYEATVARLAGARRDDRTAPSATKADRTTTTEHAGFRALQLTRPFHPRHAQKEG